GRAARDVAEGRHVLKTKAPAAGALSCSAQGARGGLGDVPGGGKRAQQPTGADRADVAQSRAVLWEDNVELGDELAEVVLTLPHQPGAEAGELAQALDLRGRDVARLGGPGAQEPGDDVGIEVNGGYRWWFDGSHWGWACSSSASWSATLYGVYRL